MVVSIPIRVEDSRQRHWLVDVPDVPLADIAALVKAFPRTQFILVNGAGFAGSPLGEEDSGLPSNYVIEISRLTALLGNEIGQLIANLGADRLVFGTGMPFNYPDPAILKIKVLDASEDDKEKIPPRKCGQIVRRTGGLGTVSRPKTGPFNITAIR